MKASQPTNVLFLCTANSARSILAESILNKVGNGRFKAFSAGSQPGGRVNRDGIRLLEELGYPTENLGSKSWHEFAAPDAPEMDVVITVCNNAAGETCPVWSGRPATDHWDIADPAGVGDNDEERRSSFLVAFHDLESRIGDFVRQREQKI